MSENEKDHADFEFIKEQVIEKKYRKIKKRIFPFLITIILAIIFGLVAAITFVLAEPRLYQMIQKNNDPNSTVNFPTITPQEVNQPSVTAKPSVTKPPVNDDSYQNGQGLDSKTLKAIDNYSSMYNDVKKVADQADKSLVNITSTYKVDDWFGDADKQINTTGVIVANNSTSYLVLASLDRVKNAKHIKAKFSDTAYVEMEIQDYDSELNLALLSLPMKEVPTVYENQLKVADLGESYGIAVGNPVIAVGNPNGYLDSMDIGIITSRGNYSSITDNSVELFHTDIDMNKNSDGVILTLDGKIVGVITRSFNDDMNKDLCTVIGISKIKQLIVQMGTKEPRIYFGIKADELSEQVKKHTGVTYGIYVNEVLADSPAFDAGIRDGDIILSIENQIILNTNSFYNIITANKAGEEVTVRIKRTTGSNEKDMTVKVALAEKPK